MLFMHLDVLAKLIATMSIVIDVDTIDDHAGTQSFGDTIVDRESIAPEDWTVSAYDFGIRGTEEAWVKFWSPLPPPMHHDISALVRAGKVRMDGNIDMLLANFLYLKLMLEQLRGHYQPEAA